MGVAGIGRDHRRLEGRGIAELGITVAGGEGRRRYPAAAAAPAAVARHRVGAVIVRHQGAGEIDLAAGDMAVDVDAARHDDAAGEIVGAVDLRARFRRIDDAAILDMEITDLAALSVGGVDDAPAGEQQAAHRRPPGSSSKRSI